jgi:phosphoribosylamine--glycine ligase
MNTRDSPKVIEFNARFGDPEAMNVLSLLASEMQEIVERIVEGTLSGQHVRFEHCATVCKYIVPEKYPETKTSGSRIAIGDTGTALLYYANVEEREGSLYTESSRTLAFVGKGTTLEEAEQAAEQAAASVSGPVRYRRDIGTPALLERRIAHMKEVRG